MTRVHENDNDNKRAETQLPDANKNRRLLGLTNLFEFDARSKELEDRKASDDRVFNLQCFKPQDQLFEFLFFFVSTNNCFNNGKEQIIAEGEAHYIPLFAIPNNYSLSHTDIA